MKKLIFQDLTPFLFWRRIFRIALVLVMVLSGCAGYVPGRQTYWDAQVKEMCQKDGGITVYEIVELSQEQYSRLGGNRGALPVPNLKIAKDYPYVRERIETKLHEVNPEVVRAEELIKRRSDGKVLARSIQYWRRGGDFPSGIGHESYFMCPEPSDMTKQIFKVSGTAR